VADRKASKRNRSGARPSLKWWIASLALLMITAVWAGIYFTRPRAAAEPAPTEVGEIPHIHGLAVDPFDSTTLWIGSHGSLIRVTAGRWARVGRQTFDMMGFNVHPSQANVLLTSGHPGQADRRPNPLGVEISRDGGQSWQRLALTGAADFHAMTISRADPQKLYAWNVSGRIGLYRSRDGGRSWEYLGERGPGRVFYLTVHPSKGNVVFAGTDRGLLVSEDGGMTWRAHLSADVLNVPITAVEFHPTNSEIAYAYAARSGLGLIRSMDGGKRWTPVGFFLGDRDAVGNLALDPKDPQVVFLATFSGDLYRSGDGGRTRERWVSAGKIVTR